MTKLSSCFEEYGRSTGLSDAEIAQLKQVQVSKEANVILEKIVTNLYSVAFNEGYELAIADACAAEPLGACG